MRARQGFTLIEIVIAMAILLIVMLTLVTLTGRTVHITTISEREQAAIQLATDRTDEVRTNPKVIEAYLGKSAHGAAA